MDKSIVSYTRKNAVVVRALAEFSVNYTINRKNKTFRTDTLADKAIKAKFKKNGYGGNVRVQFSNYSNDGLPDSCVVFEEITLRGVLETIYDFTANGGNYASDSFNTGESVFLKVTERIYYRRRPIPMM